MTLRGDHRQEISDFLEEEGIKLFIYMIYDKI